MALGAIFGTLAGLGNTGEQLAEARQYNADETMKKLAFAQRQKSENAEIEARRAEAAQRLQEFQRQTKKDSQPVMVPGSDRVVGGKMIANFRHPDTGEITEQELPGGPGETSEQTMFRGLMSIPGMTEETASQSILAKMKGKPGALHREVTPSPDSATGYVATYYDADGNAVWTAETAPPSRLVPRETTRTSTDQFGNTTTSNSLSSPVLPGGAKGGGGGVAAPQAAATPAKPGLAHARKVLGLDGAAPAAPGAAPAASAPPSGQTLNVGTYKGLDANGNIPMRPGMNPLVLQFANDILNGQDVTKIPMKARAAAESVARAYGWKGQGSLTPKEQLQIQEPAAVIDTMLRDPGILAVLDDKVGRLKLQALPTEVPQAAGVTPTIERMFTGAVYRRLTPKQNEYLQYVNQLRSLMGGLRKITGGNVSEAQVQRYITELPDPVTTPNSAEARNKLLKLRNELQVAMRYGYFPKEAGAAAPSGPAAPSDAGGHDIVVDPKDMGPN